MTGAARTNICDRAGGLAKRTVGTLLFFVAMLFATATSAQPCTSPGEPVGCIEIDSPIDAQVWILIVLTIMFSAYFLVKRPQKAPVQCPN